MWFFLAVNTLAWGAGQTEILDEKSCYSAPRSLLDGLEAGWWQMLPYSQICPVRNENAQDILYVLTDRKDLWAEDEHAIAETLRNHWGGPENALIFDRNYKIIGHFLGQFPSDGPVHMEVTFTDWRDGYPWRIEFAYTERHRDGTPREPPPPLLWNATNGVYQ